MEPHSSRGICVDCFGSGLLELIVSSRGRFTSPATRAEFAWTASAAVCLDCFLARTFYVARDSSRICVDCFGSGLLEFSLISGIWCDEASPFTLPPHTLRFRGKAKQVSK